MMSINGTLVFGFCLALGFLFWTYAGYPIFLWILMQWKSNQAFHSNPDISNQEFPRLGILLVSREVTSRLWDRIENLLYNGYPVNRLHLYLVLDGGFESMIPKICERYPDSLISVFVQNPPKGKMAGICLALPFVTEPYVLFCDLWQDFPNHTLENLVREAMKNQYGALSGELILRETKESRMKGIQVYWQIEKWIREAENFFQGSVGCTGAIYVAARHLIPTNLPSNMILDDLLIPMWIAKNGGRIGFSRSGQAYEQRIFDSQQEYGRKLRTLAGNYQLLFRYPWWILPFGHPQWFSFFSHKVLRLCSPWLLMFAFLSNITLAWRNGHWIPMLWIQIILYGLGIIGLLRPNWKFWLIHIPSTFLWLNLCALIAMIHWWKGTFNRGWRSSIPDPNHQQKNDEYVQST